MNTTKDIIKKIIRRRATIALIAVVAIVISFMATSLTAEGSTELEKRYKTIEIQHGDTLWSIASEYCTETTSLEDYIKDIKFVNNLSSDNISSGNYLVVSYFE